MSLAGILRRELAERAQEYACARSLPHSLSYGEAPIVCFAPCEKDVRHGNFLDGSYRAIQANPEWKRRLAKVHTQGRRSLPQTNRGLWMELDSCASSDALLMNVFCYPGMQRNRQLATLLGTESDVVPIFGYRARVPLANGRFDRTEVDLRWGNVLVEAKLTETDFQVADKRILAGYRDFAEVFNGEQLPQTESRYLSYQLLRNVLAAYALECAFCVLVDSRRPDLTDAWYAVMRCVKPIKLRTQLRILTWQEVAHSARPKVREFLSIKYGIGDRPKHSRR
jgi:hypothetical protein